MDNEEKTPNQKIAKAIFEVGKATLSEHSLHPDAFDPLLISRLTPLLKELPLEKQARCLSKSVRQEYLRRMWNYFRKTKEHQRNYSYHEAETLAEELYPIWGLIERFHSAIRSEKRVKIHGKEYGEWLKFTEEALEERYYGNTLEDTIKHCDLVEKIANRTLTQEEYEEFRRSGEGCGILNEEQLQKLKEMEQRPYIPRKKSLWEKLFD